MPREQTCQRPWSRSTSSIVLSGFHFLLQMLWLSSLQHAAAHGALCCRSWHHAQQPQGWSAGRHLLLLPGGLHTNLPKEWACEKATKEAA